MTLAGIVWLIGMGLVFVGEQIVGDGVARWVVDAAGLLAVAGSAALRWRSLQAEHPSVRHGATLALQMSILASTSLVTYALSTPDAATAFGLYDDAADRLTGVFATLTPILLILGATPMFSLDLVLANNPTVLPRNGALRALFGGLTAALAVSLVFPANYLANHYSVEWDTAYFRTTRPGEATRGIVARLAKKVDVYLFFPAGNDVLEEIRPYFQEIEAASGGMLQVSVRDQALEVGLAEELKLQDNGWVVFKEEGEPVKFKLRLELDKAKRDLKQLDSLVQKNLLNATRGQRTAYLVVGHGEATHRAGDGGDWRKLAQVKKVLQNQSYRVDDLGLVQGLAEQVPADADLVILPGPTEPLSPEEIGSLTRWLDAGGKLMVLVDARGDGAEGVLAHLGLKGEPGPIADPKNRYPGQSPYLIVTNRYGTHAVVEKFNKAQQPVVLPGPIGLSELPDVQTKRTPLLRSFGTAYADANLNGRQDPEETAKVHNLAYAVEGGSAEKPWRAVVIGNVGFASDAAVASGWLVGPQLLIDASRWLAGDEDTMGETSSEEDVRIDHSPEGQRWWFWGTIFAVPLLVLGGGFAWVFGRRRIK
jgi:hypothetical protein